MLASAPSALIAVERIIAIAVILQTVELWQFRRVAADDGVWRWSTVRRELDVFPAPIRRLLDAVLGYRGFLAVLGARLAAAIALIAEPHVAVVLVLLASTVLIALRWRGSVNGGSDFMTLVVLTALAVATAVPDRTMVTVGCLFYIALQTCNSYFIAGLAKLRSASWRQGTALPIFLAGTVHDSTALAAALGRHPVLARLGSWSVIGLELSLPLALFDPTLCLVLVALAFGFHLANAYVFGLNRFLWAWAATYPALYYASQVVAASWP